MYGHNRAGMGARLWDVEEGNCRVPQTLLQKSKVPGNDNWFHRSPGQTYLLSHLRS